VSIPEQSAFTITRAIVTKVFSSHGVPQMSLSDQDQNLTTGFIKEVCSLLRAVKPPTRPYNVKCNGQVENFHIT